MFPKSWKSFSLGYSFKWLPHTTHKMYCALLRFFTTATTLPPTSRTAGTCTPIHFHQLRLFTHTVQKDWEKGEPGGLQSQIKSLSHSAMVEIGACAGTQGPYLYLHRYMRILMHILHLLLHSILRGRGVLWVVDILLLYAHSVPGLSNWYDIVYLTVLPPVM